MWQTLLLVGHTHTPTTLVSADTSHCVYKIVSWCPNRETVVVLIYTQFFLPPPAELGCVAGHILAVAASVWQMSQMYHMMHSNQGNQEMKVLHGERKGNLHLHIQIKWSPWGWGSAPCSPLLLSVKSHRLCVQASVVHASLNKLRE